MNEIFEWDRFLFNELPTIYLVEVLARSLVMYIVILTALRLSGKRGVKQLSIYELVLIIGLGSAAGDPMFYNDVGLLPAIFVFVVIISLYRLTTWLSVKSDRIGTFLEGEPVILISDGKFALENFRKENLAQTEFFSELRQQNVEHLGQIRIGIIEPTGEFSLYYFEEKDVKPGLPLIPRIFNDSYKFIDKKAIYACKFCGDTQEIEKGILICPICKRDEWVTAISTRRIT